MIMVMSLSSCASVSYETADGTKVSYFRLFTSADSIKAQVGAAKVEANGQKLDAETLNAILGLMAK
jgi:hypothetical protein